MLAAGQPDISFPQVEHVTMDCSHPLSNPPLLWPLGLRNEPAVNLEWCCNSQNFPKTSRVLSPPWPWSMLAAVTPATAGLTQRALLGPRGRISIVVTLPLLDAKTQTGHAQVNSTDRIGEVSTVASQQEGPYCTSWPGAFVHGVSRLSFCLWTFPVTHSPTWYTWAQVHK